MKLSLFRIVVLMPKYSAISLIVICVLNSTVTASTGKAQKYVSVYETYIETGFQDMSLAQIFEKIEALTSYKFSYHQSDVDNKPRISIDQGKNSVAEVLISVSKMTHLQFKQANNNISVKNTGVRIKDSEKLEVYISDVIITGKVTDDNGESLVGVSVIISGTTTGTITDINGDFSIEVPENSILSFSYIGYKTQEVGIVGRSIIDVQMTVDARQLKDIVVVGYGTSTKEKFNGSVSKVDNKKLTSYSSANFEQSLVGNVAGVQIGSNGKNPGDNSVIQIRGVNTLTAGTNPLIVVDGNPLSEGSSLSSVNTNDIESVSILKDAASAAIYGSRASNGVILITTKKGKSGSVKVTYDGYSGVQQRIDKFELTDAYGTALFDYDARNFGYVSGGSGRSIIPI